MSQPYDILSESGIPLFYNPYTGQYTKNRSYARRMQRGFAAGLTRQQARGHGINAQGLTEYQSRRQRQQQPIPGPDVIVPPSPEFQFRQMWGFELSYWIYLRENWVDAINARTSPAMQITPAWIQQELANADLLRSIGEPAGEEWLEPRLGERLADIIEYQDYGNPDPGFVHFNYRDDLRPIEWWFYH